MAGRSSQNAPARHPNPHAARRRQALVCPLLGFAFLLAACAAVDHFLDSELGRTLNSHLSEFADPHSWIP